MIAHGLSAVSHTEFKTRSASSTWWGVPNPLHVSLFPFCITPVVMEGHHRAFGMCCHGNPGDPKSLVTSQSPEKVSIQIALHQRVHNRETKMEFVLRNVTFLKNTTFIFLPLPPFPYFRASNVGKIHANFSWEIVTSQAVLDHRDVGWVSGCRVGAVGFLAF